LKDRYRHFKIGVEETTKRMFGLRKHSPYFIIKVGDFQLTPGSVWHLDTYLQEKPKDPIVGFKTYNPESYNQCTHTSEVSEVWRISPMYSETQTNIKQIKVNTISVYGPHLKTKPKTLS
jgi:hypothetical protein